MYTDKLSREKLSSIKFKRIYMIVKCQPFLFSYTTHYYTDVTSFTHSSAIGYIKNHLNLSYIRFHEI